MKKRTALISFVILISAFSIRISAHSRDSLLIVFWNLENFFDYTDNGGGDSDKEFSSSGHRHWTKKRFYTKCDAVAKTIMWMSDIYGRMPDVIGVAEVENRGVLTRMLRSTLLRKYDYGIIHRESADKRGIDVALLYRTSVMDTLSVSYKAPLYQGQRMATRDILHARMSLCSGHTADFIVNHHPSKFGGEEASKWKRHAAMHALNEMCDSLDSQHIIAMGDFNDTPDAEQFEIIENVLTNMSVRLYNEGLGTIRYQGRWDMIDMFLTSPQLAEKCHMDIVKVPFLMTFEKKHPGEKPLRTYIGPRYSGGVSDHCPIVLRLSFN